MTDENNQQQVPENQDNVPQPSEVLPVEQALEKHPEVTPEELPKESVEATKRSKTKIIKIGAIIIAAIAAIGIIIYLFSIGKRYGWISNQMVAVYIALGLLITGVVSWLILRKTFRTRLKMEKIMKEDPDIDDWLVIFDLSKKALYVPTIIASFLAAILLQIPGINETVIGGIWFGIFLVNFFIEEYNISIKVLLIVSISIGFFLLWLHLFGKVMDFLGFFKKIVISMNVHVYLLVGILGVLTIFISWLRGLFYYVSLTPNYMNLQDGPTESGEQIGREDYNTRIDTSDFLERLMGFGRIIITFKEKDNEPISLLVWRIKSKAEKLERVRGKFAIDYANSKVKSVN